MSEAAARDRFRGCLLALAAGVVGVTFATVDSRDACVAAVSPYGKPGWAKPEKNLVGPTEFYVRVGNATKPPLGGDLLEHQAGHGRT